ncbi:MAG: DUF4347 domain-containing protein, partial [Pirellulales bacterium]
MQPPRSAPDYGQLEERVMMSASPIAAALPGVEPGLDPADQAAAPSPDVTATADAGDHDVSVLDASTPDTAAQSGGMDFRYQSTADAQQVRIELVIIDAAVSDYQQLVDDLLSQQSESRRFEVVMLDGTRDGIEQISQALANYENIDALHIVSHATDGAVSLGSIRLSLDNLGGYAGQLVGWRDHLTFDADILFYGCDLAAHEDGQTFIESLAELTGADVAASTDATGHESLGGNWFLEYAVGQIDAGVAFSADLQAHWWSTLATATFQEGSSGYASTQDTEIQAGNPTTSYGNDASIRVDLDDSGGVTQGLIRFDNLFGNGVGQIPLGSTITSVSLTVYVTEASTAGSQVGLHRMLVNWSEASTWNSLSTSGSGVQTNNIEANSTADSILGSPTSTGLQTFTLSTGTLQAWSDGATNYGWALVINNTNGWEFASSEYGTAGQRPMLSVTYTPPNTAPVLDASKSPALSAINEDASAPSGAVGTLVSQLVDFASPSGQVDNITDPDSGAQLGIAVTAADTANGSWFYSTNNGGSWSALGAVANNNARLLAADASTRLYFQPNANYNGTLASAITFRAWDQTSGSNGGLANTTTNGGTTAFSSATDTASLTVNAVNDAPANTVPGAQSVDEDAALVFTVANGNAISISDIDAGASSVQVTLAVTNGTLSLGGTGGLTFSTGDGNADSSMTFSGSVSNINLALAGLSYSPTANYAGAATLTITTSDLGNTGSGGTLTDVDNIAITVNAVNDPPEVTATAAVLAYTENSTIAIDSGLIVTDVDSNITGATVTIASGYINGQDVLAFTNQLGITGSWNAVAGILTLSGTTTAANYQTALRTVTYHNTSDAPNTTARVIAFVVNDGTVNSNAGAQTTLLTANFAAGTNGFSYMDDPFGTADPTKADGVYQAAGGFTGGGLQVYLSAGPNAGAVSGGWSNTFNATSAGEVVISLRYRLNMGEGFETDEYGEVVLTVDGTRYGSDTNNTVFHMVGNDNGGGTESSGWRQATIRLNVTAGAHTVVIGAYGNQSTANDEWIELLLDDVSVSQTGNSRTVSITAVNDAPTITNSATVTLAATNEDTTSNGTTADAILTGASWADVDSSPQKGIAITSKTGNGTWQYSTDGATWAAFGAVSTSNALLITSTTQVRYIPDGLNGETATFGFKAWDQTTGTASTNAVPGYADPGAGGGTTAYSSQSATASLTVTSINDAPTITNGATYNYASVNEDTTSAAQTVTTIVNATGWADVDTGAARGMAITGQTGNGTWQYSTDGATWNTFGAVSATNALLLGATTQLRYIPDQANGETATFSYRAWDQTTGTASTNATQNYANPSAGGGTTAYSANSASAQIVVTSVNDAPTITNGATYNYASVNEDTTSAAQTVTTIVNATGWADVDTGAVRGMAITGMTGNGTWQYSTDGATWNTFGAVSATNALLLGATTQLRYIPDQANGETATFSYRSWDQTTGTASTNATQNYANPGAGGGTTAYSANSASAQIVVTSVNDAPVLDNSKNPALVAQDENSGAPSGAVGTLVSALVDFANPAGQVDNVTDVDSGALLGMAVTAADTSNGSWWYSTNNGGNWNALGAVANNNARLLAADVGTRIYFQPNASYNGTLAAAITFRAWDQTSGGNGGLADTSVNGGTTAFSSATDTASLVINSVNDVPVAVDDAYSVNEDTTLNIAAAGVLANDTDIDLDPLTAVLVAGPSNGLLTLNADGSFSYTPNANFNGTDSFTYRANDGTATSI